MKKSILRRGMSMLLAVAMLIGIMPVFELQAAQAAETVEYNLKQSGSGDFAATTYSTKGAYTDPTGKHTAAALNWDYYEMNAGNNWSYFQFRGYDFKLSFSAASWLALELDAPGEAGDYRPEFYISPAGDMQQAKVYLIPESALASSTVADEIADGDYLVSDNVSFVSDTAKTIEFGVRTLNNEKHILVIKGTGNALLYSFSLVPVNPAASITAESDKASIAVGEKTHVAITEIKNEKGNDIDFKGTTVTYEVDEGSENASAVSLDTATGIVTGVEPGSARIKVTAEKDGGKATATVDITVTAQSASLPERSGAYNNYTLNLRNRTAWSSDIVDGITYAETGSDWADYGFSPNAASDAFLRQWVGSALSPDYRRVTPGDWYGIKIKVPATGRYNGKLTYQKHTASGNFNIHMVPTTVLDVDAAVKSGYYKIAYLEGFSDKVANDVLLIEDIIVKKSAEHYLIFETAQGSTKQYNFLIGFELDGRAPFAKLELGCDEKAIKTGKTGRVYVKNAMREDGKLINPDDGMTFAYESSDTLVATVSDNGTVTGVSAGTAEITVTAEFEGNTVVSEPFEVTVADEVEALDYSGEQVYSNLVYRSEAFIAASGGAIDIRGITYDFTDGNWQDGKYKLSYTPNEGSLGQYKNSYLRMSLPTGDWWALKLKVDKAGLYTAFLDYSVYNTGAVADIYLVPGATADLDNALKNDRYRIGQANFYEDGCNTMTSKRNFFGDIELETAGEYWLVFKGNGGTGSSYLFLNGFELSGLGPLGSVNAKLEKEGSINLGESCNIAVTMEDNGDTRYTIDDVEASYKSADENIATVDGNGVVTAVNYGQTEVIVTATIGKYSREYSIPVLVGSGKTRRSFYSDEKVANARENIEKYSWARSTRDSAVRIADKFVENADKLYDMVTGPDLPRSTSLGFRGDPNNNTCPACGIALVSIYGSNPWVIDTINSPWKIQCPNCRKKFPSNDFEGFYELGMQQDGTWSYEKAKAANAELVRNGEKGFLYNKEHPELGDETWGVDDGYGWYTGNMIPVADKDYDIYEARTFIALYNFQGIWRGDMLTAMLNLRDAYLYTGDIKYGRVGAKVIDRIADLYPSFDINQTDPSRWFHVADGSLNRGKIGGKIYDYNFGVEFSTYYDAFWPAMEDPQVISFLSEKAEEYGLSNPKTSAELIRINCENNLLREINKAVRDCRIEGNFPQHQQTLITAAIALDTLPETKEWIDWCFKTGGRVSAYENSGGNINAQLVDLVGRDGFGNESAPGYNVVWINNLTACIDALAGYDKYPEVDLINNPKVQSMFAAHSKLIMCSRYAPLIGDTITMAQSNLIEQLSVVLMRYGYVNDPEIAKFAYFLNGNRTEGLHASIFTKDPEAIKEEIEKTLKTSSDIQLNSESENITHYGFAALRDGKFIPDVLSERSVDTQRGFSMHYVERSNHGHDDKLSIDVYAYGMNMASDLGGPENKSVDDAYRDEFVVSSVSHNTVTVNDGAQKRTKSAKPLHFDDAGMVKLADVSAADVYAVTEEYRRTLVMVDADDDISYGVDFFRVVGGDEHLYSFHGVSTEAQVFGADMTLQNGGSYAGADVEYGAMKAGATHPVGYSYFKDVRRAADTKNPVSVDWAITDFHNTLAVPASNLRMRLTMLNDLDELAVANGRVPQYVGNPETVPFMLARRSGKNLDTLFMSVIEPYKGEVETDRYIENIQEVDVKSDKDSLAKAVKVTLKNGREDYIVYSPDNTAVCTVDDGRFTCSGFVSVYSYSGEELVYSYVNDAPGNEIVGSITAFSEKPTMDSIIEIATTSNVAPESLAGKYIYADVGENSSYNGVFKIESAEEINGGFRLHLGNVSLIRAFKNANDFSMGYMYYIDEGDTFRIPLSQVNDNSPVFDEVSDKSVVEGKKISFMLNASSGNGEEITYEAVSLPRGATLSNDGEFSWTPDSKQIGKNIVAVRANNGALSSTEYFGINVVKSSGSGVGNDSGTSPDEGSSDLGGGSGGASGGGGGSSSGGGSASSGNEGNADSGDDSGEKEDGVIDVPTAPAEKFIDLGNHAWAKDAIYALADKGIINGTSENTYSPGKDITRADFAVLLVRAFGIKSESTDNFTDVAADAYYAKELAAAKANGIINGVGNGLYKPTETITREDMMTIVSRTLDVLGYELKDASVETLAEFADSAEISGYAAEHVGALIANEIVKGSNGRIMPKSNTTRAEVAVLIDRLITLFVNK